MRCPRCDVDLAMSERQGVEIDYCPKCRGVWLDRGELDKIIDRSADHDQPQPAAYAPPPPRPAHFPTDDDRWVHKHQHRRKKSFLQDIFDFD
ncbi:MAG: zf-TFIIB domain-containing protein [Pseudomonadota bacterium]